MAAKASGCLQSGSPWRARRAARGKETCPPRPRVRAAALDDELHGDDRRGVPLEDGDVESAGHRAELQGSDTRRSTGEASGMALAGGSTAPRRRGPDGAQRRHQAAPLHAAPERPSAAVSASGSKRSRPGVTAPSPDRGAPTPRRYAASRSAAHGSPAHGARRDGLVDRRGARRNRGQRPELRQQRELRRHRAGAVEPEQGSPHPRAACSLQLVVTELVVQGAPGPRRRRTTPPRWCARRRRPPDREGRRHARGLRRGDAGDDPRRAHEAALQQSGTLIHEERRHEVELRVPGRAEARRHPHEGASSSRPAILPTA